MERVRRAIWYIEQHYREPVTLADIAKATGTSRFHLSRMFSGATGRPLTAYLRSRRLSEAARHLATTTDSVTSTAFLFGYSSHEGFTRAFSSEFGQPPDAVRRAGCIATLSLTETIDMETNSYTLPKPRIEETEAMTLVGLREFCSYDDIPKISEQWQRFVPHIGSIAGRRGGRTFGVELPAGKPDSGFDYMAAVEIDPKAATPMDLSRVDVPKGVMAVFPFDDHLSRIHAACAAIFSDWTPPEGYAASHDPVALMERYAETFDPAIGRGGIALCVPLVKG